MKKLLLFFVLVFSCLGLSAQSVTITEAKGWLESAIVKWDPVSGADSYNVYYTGGGVVNKKIDTQLIRSYGTYFRADVLGLAAGDYTIKVAPVISGVEGSATETSSVKVLPHDRTGFAFYGGRVPGAYKADGTLKDNAVVIYITQDTKNTVSLNVTGATTNPCVGLQTILDGFKKGKDTRPLVVRLLGNITDMNYMLGGDIVIENANNASSYITFEGVGSDAYANGWGLRIKNASNIEVRNIGFMLTDAAEGDNVGLQQTNDYVWVHNNDLFYGSAGGDADQAKGDGAMDAKKSNYVTMSYNHFWDTGKSNLLGLSEGPNPGFVTYHHNWYDHSDSRHPRIRYFTVHVYNNYYDGNSKYGIGSTLGSSVFVEGNYFRACKYPILTSYQGSDVWDDTKKVNDYKNMPIFSGEAGGSIKAYNNYMTGEKRFIAYGQATTDPFNSSVDFDAYVVSNRGDQVPSSVVSYKGANTYNNFDTNPAYYVNSLTIQSPEDAKNTVMQYAGRVEGGDFKWTFDNAVDDASYAVNIPLMNALKNYNSSLVFVQGISGSVTSSQTLAIATNNDQTVTTGTAIAPMVFTWGGTATDATVVGLPASGIDFVKDATAKTITISGTPTADVSFTVETSGAIGTPVSGSGNITVSSEPIVPAGNQIHNFTVSEKVSTFYSITGNMNSTNGSVTYDGLDLTRNLKIESATRIVYTTSAISTLTLVFDSTFNGKIKLTSGTDITITANTTSYTAVNGIVIIPNLPAGTYTINKGDTTNLFYIKTEYGNLSTTDFAKENLVIYPNPVVNQLHISVPNNTVEKVTVFNVAGHVVKSVVGNVNTVDLSKLNSGLYLIQVKTKNGILNKKVIKK